MRCLVVYDISDGRARAKVADYCQDYGLSRIQYSAFLGDISRAHQNELLQKIRRRLARLESRVVLLPLCETDFRARREVVIS
ncbi:MAG: CRISPR-associated endonuclease Cas2 [Chloroflexi bacterium]|nr:CRISPR-associated endonuclease Cas2 [Chloroflexota bacterium]